jgi:hypothetical protein
MSKNCVNLQDVIHKQHLVSACVFSFFIGDEELFDHLPLSHSSVNVPVCKAHCTHLQAGFKLRKLLDLCWPRRTFW